MTQWHTLLRTQIGPEVWMLLSLSEPRTALTRAEWEGMKAFLDLTMQMIEPPPVSEAAPRASGDAPASPTP